MIHKILKKVCYFKHLDDKDIEKIAKIAKIIEYPPKVLVFNKNEIGNNFFIVKSGKVKIYTSIGRKTKTIAIINKNDFFGEMSLLGGRTRSASAMTITESELYVISRKNFEKHLLKNPEFSIKLMHTLVQRLIKANREIEAMLFHNILGRLAYTILEIRKSNNNSNIINIDQQEIANYMGTTRVPVCRAINTLKKAGVLNYSRGKMVIKDLEKLISMSKNK